MAQPNDKFENPDEIENFYQQTAEFNAGYLTDYDPSMITTDEQHQQLAAGFPIGRRFKSAMTGRVCDLVPTQIGHEHTADGRWRVYVFADAADPGESEALQRWSDWAKETLSSELFDLKLVHQQRYTDFDMSDVPAAFKPKTGSLELTDMEKAFGTLEDHDIFEERSVARDGAVVVVRPDQYVAGVFPLEGTQELEAFLGGVFPAVRAVSVVS